MTQKSDAKVEEKLICCFKNDKYLVTFDLSITFDLKKYIGDIFHDREEWRKIWRKTNFWFGKWHEEFGKFSPEHSKVSELGLWWDPFIQIRKSMSLKFTEMLYVMTMKNVAKLDT